MPSRNFALSIGSDYSVCVAGEIQYSDMEASTTAISDSLKGQVANFGPKDIFLEFINPDGTTKWRSYYGGSDDESIGGLVYTNKNIFLTGGTRSTDIQFGKPKTSLTYNRATDWYPQSKANFTAFFTNIDFCANVKAKIAATDSLNYSYYNLYANTDSLYLINKYPSSVTCTWKLNDSLLTQETCSGIWLRNLPTNTYNLTLTVSDSLNGCFANDTVNIETIEQIDCINFIALTFVSDTIALLGQPILFADSTLGAKDYYWDMGNDSAEFSQLFQYIYQAPSLYTVIAYPQYFDPIGQIFCYNSSIITIRIVDTNCTIALNPQIFISKTSPINLYDSVDIAGNYNGMPYTCKWYSDTLIFYNSCDTFHVVATDPGIFKLKYIVTGEFGVCKGEDTLTVMVKGLPSAFDTKNKKSVIFYPNPANRYITLNSQVNQLEIYSLDGRKIKSFNLNSSELRIDISDVLSGLYLIKII